MTTTLPYKIFWVGEDSECYVADSIEQLRAEFNYMEEDIADGNYGEIDPAEVVSLRDDETGDVFEGPYVAFVAKEFVRGAKIPFLLSTAYA